MSWNSNQFSTGHKNVTLVVGSHLLTVNTYKNNFKIDQDLIIGPLYNYTVGSRQHRSRWSGFEPIIADFVTNDLTRVEIRKDHIEESEWDRAYKMGKIYEQVFRKKFCSLSELEEMEQFRGKG